MGAVNFSGWRPIRFYTHAGRVQVDWMRLGDEPLLAPFFQDSIQRQMRHPFHQAFRRQTPLEDLLAWHAQSPGLAPSLVTFHVSRCGSTLITQTLAESPHHLQLSEPAPVDYLLRVALPQGLLDRATTVQALRAWNSAWAQRSDPASPALQSCSLKMDAWNTRHAALVAEAWPNAPWLFLAREPLSVMVSQMRERGFFLVPGSLGGFLDGVTAEDQLRMPTEQYCARVLGAIYAAMVREFAPARTLLLDHADLPGAIIDQVLPHMRWHVPPHDHARMRERLTRHSKHPHQPYVSDTLPKHSMASDLLHSVTAQWITPHYQALQDLRRAHGTAARPQPEEALP